MNELRDPARFDAALRSVGFTDVSTIEVSNDFPVDAAAIGDPGQLFRSQP